MLRFQSSQQGTASLSALGPGEIISVKDTISSSDMIFMNCILVCVYHDIRLPGGPWGPWQFASGAVVKAFRLNSYNNNVNNNINNNNNNVNFNALNTANALNTVSLTGLGSLYGSNVLRPSVIYRCDY